VDLRSGIVQGVETLIRWRHPEFGLVAPDRFILLAEETGLIVPIGEWVLRTACAQVKAWHAEGYSHLRMAVNLSTRQFHHQDIAEFVRRVLNETGLAAAYLKLELTESLLAEDSERMLEVLREIKAIGVDLFTRRFRHRLFEPQLPQAFSDRQLENRPLVYSRCDHSQGDASLTKAIIAKAQSLNMTTVAEGVETEDQLSFYWAPGCDTLQGYYFSRPLPAPDITALFRADKRLSMLKCIRKTTRHSFARSLGSATVRLIQINSLFLRI